MKQAEARQLISDSKFPDGQFNEEDLADLLIWAFDDGWVKGRDDLMSELREFNTKGE